MTSTTTTKTTTKITVAIHTTTLDPEDDPGLGANDDDDDDRASPAVRVTRPRDGGSGVALAAPDTHELDELGVFTADGSIVFRRSGILITMDRFGTLPDGRVLFTVAKAVPLPTRDPRPGDEGC